MAKTVVLIVTSHDALGTTDRKTGFWLEELATPFYVLKGAGMKVIIASPKGGLPPIDPGSLGDASQTEDTRKFQGDAYAQELLHNTVKIESLDAKNIDGAFIVGGHGVLWDVANSAVAKAFLEALHRNGKAIAAVCHGPAALAQLVDDKAESLVKNQKVTGFSNEEETIIQLTSVVPIRIEDTFKSLGGVYSSISPWKPHVEVSRNHIVTGQNPASSHDTAVHFIRLVREQGGRSRVLIIGGNGTIGKAVVNELGGRWDVITAGRNSGDVKVDLTSESSIAAMYRQVGPVHAVVCCAGNVAFAPLLHLNHEKWDLGLQDKLMGQIRLVQIGAVDPAFVHNNGSFTLTSGILSDDPIVFGASASVVNAGLNAFAKAAAIELPRGLRVNAVSPTLLTESAEAYRPYFLGFETVPASKVARAYSRSVDGAQTGQVYEVFQ